MKKKNRSVRQSSPRVTTPSAGKQNPSILEISRLKLGTTRDRFINIEDIAVNHINSDPKILNPLSAKSD